MELVDIHTFSAMDLDSESRVIAPTSAREIRNMRLNEFGKSGVLVGMRGTKKIHETIVPPPIVHTLGNINVGIGIQGLPEDETYFRIILTGTSPERPVFSQYINQQQSYTFENIPLGTYEVTQELPTGYGNISIVETPVTISESNRYANVWVLNTMGFLRDTYASDPNRVNTYTPYFAMERFWSAGPFDFTLEQMTLNGVEYASGQTLHIGGIGDGDLITGVGLDGKVYVMNVSDWVNTILPEGWMVYDDMNVMDRPIGSSYVIHFTLIVTSWGIPGPVCHYYYSSEYGLSWMSLEFTFGMFTSEIIL